MHWVQLLSLCFVIMTINLLLAVGPGFCSGLEEKLLKYTH